ncbi:MAG: hypothetical protein F6K10_31905 [Moorea sp. SIO2B7]|nr:hypothetical protein [Moorena sp. SIO2B7]
MGSTNLAGALQEAFKLHFERGGQSTILVVTDGAPDNRKAVFRTIIEATQKISEDKELGVSLLQIGNDSGATEFLKACDDQLQGAGAAFDIVDTVTFDQMEDMSLREVLLNAVND